jgi:hypothetical protein
MKLRIKGNSIRLRLGRSEVAGLAKTGIVEESTIFDPAGLHRLTYQLVATSEVDVVTASFRENALTVRVPTELANAWATTDRRRLSRSRTVNRCGS